MFPSEETKEPAVAAAAPAPSEQAQPTDPSTEVAAAPAPAAQDENEQAIELHAKQILDHYDDNPLADDDSEEFMIYSLEYLDKINVRTVIEIYYDNDDDLYKYSLEIREKRHGALLHHDMIHASDDLDIDNIKIAIKVVIEKFEKFTYCKIRNLFVKDKYVILCNGKYLNPAKLSDCCVCHEKTSSLTNCQHFICMQCATQLVTHACPMCRKCLHF